MELFFAMRSMIIQLLCFFSIAGNMPVARHFTFHQNVQTNVLRIPQIYNAWLRTDADWWLADFFLRLVTFVHVNVGDVTFVLAFICNAWINQFSTRFWVQNWLKFWSCKTIQMIRLRNHKHQNLNTTFHRIPQIYSF